MDKNTLILIINRLKEDINSPIFTEKDLNDYSKAYNEGYKNALIEHLEELENELNHIIQH